jgi:hypothetical protein
MLEVLAILIALPMVLLVVAMLAYILGPIISMPFFIVEAIIHRHDGHDGSRFSAA